MTDTTVELSFKKASTPSSTRFLAEYVCGDYSVTKEEGPFNGITWVARHKGQERANFPRLLDGKRWCSEHSEKRTQAAAAQAIEDAKPQAEPSYHTAPLALDLSYPKHLATPHMPNSERVQKYARQNSAVLAEYGIASDSGTMPKLTHRQMRRVRKAANKHNEGFIYTLVAANIPAESGCALLARTPQGEGIYYRFSY